MTIFDSDKKLESEWKDVEWWIRKKKKGVIEYVNKAIINAKKRKNL